MSETNLKGFAELAKALNELPEKIERNIVRSALRKAAKVIEQEAKQNVPVRSGKLRDSIRVSVRIKDGRPLATVTAGGREKGQAFYAQFVELGTAAHAIQAKPGHALAIGGGTVVRVEHPGARPRPYMRPALDASAAAAVQAFGEQVKRRLTKHGIETPDIAVEERQE